MAFLAPAAEGPIPNYERVFGHRPHVYAAWQQLNGAIKASMDPRRYELATLAASAPLDPALQQALTVGRPIVEA
jgi:hypothetical protein